MCSSDERPVFRDLTGEDPEPEVTEIESLCINCQANGMTRLLLTRIPHYKNVIIMSFSCEECGYENNEIQSGGAYAELGVKWKLQVECPLDLNRQVVKSDYTSVKIPELDFEIPAQNQKGEVTTVEGIVTRAIAGLSQDQEQRRIDHPEVAAQIDSFIDRLQALRTVGKPWTLQLEDISGKLSPEKDHSSTRVECCLTIVEGLVTRAIAGLTQVQDQRRIDHPEVAAQVDSFIDRLQALRTVGKPLTLQLEDISGNCFIENPEAPKRDPRCSKSEFRRTKEQNHILGIFMPDEVSDEPTSQLSTPVATDSLLSPVDPDQFPYEQLTSDEVMCFRTNCPDCNAPANTNMKVTNIPHFKEVIIMATLCDACGHRTNEVKSGGGIEEKGVRFEVRIASKLDFSRDVLKSETCSMEIPELDLEVGGRALGGRFTTAEGLVRATAEQLADGAVGDAPGLNTEGLKQYVMSTRKTCTILAPRGTNLKEMADIIAMFIEKLNLVLEGKLPITIILDDPAGNSYVQSLADDPTQPDDGLKITRYERTFEQNEELGLNDMNTEEYDKTT